MRGSVQGYAAPDPLGAPMSRSAQELLAIIQMAEERLALGDPDSYEDALLDSMEVKK